MLEDFKEIWCAQAEIWQEQVQQGGQRAASSESCEHQAPSYKTAYKREVCAQ